MRGEGNIGVSFRLRALAPAVTAAASAYKYCVPAGGSFDPVRPLLTWQHKSKPKQPWEENGESGPIYGKQHTKVRMWWGSGKDAWSDARSHFSMKSGSLPPEQPRPGTGIFTCR